MRFGGIVIALVLALAACSGGDPQPREPDASASPAPTSTATLPPMPDQAKEDSPEGAAAFVDHWVDVFNYAAATGDVEELTRLSSPDCEGCQTYIETFVKVYGDDGYFREADWKISDLTIQQSEVESYATFIAATESGEYRTSSESAPKLSTGADNEVTLAIRRTGSSWVATQLGLGGVE